MIKDDLFYMQFLKKDSERNPYKYTDEYLEYLIITNIKSEEFSKDNVLAILENYYGVGHIRISRIDFFCKKYFINIGRYFYKLNDNQIFLKKIFETILIQNVEDPIEKNHYLLTNNEIQNAKNIVKMLLNVPAEREKIKYYIYLYFANKEEYDFEIKNKITFINHDVFYIKLSSYVENKFIKELLIINNIDIVKDLIKLTPNQILTLFLYDLDKINQLFLMLEMSITNAINSLEKMLQENFNEVELKILEKRIGTEKATLNEIGNTFGVSRERIRQKEKKLKNRLLEPKYIKQVNFILQYIFSSKNTKYINLEDIKKIINNIIIVNLIVFIVNEYEDSFYACDLQYNFIYDTSIISYDNIINENIEKYGDLIKFDEYSNSNFIQKKYIENNYKLVGKCVYLKKDIPNNFILLSEIKENFPKGIKVNDENLKNLKEIIFKKYKSLELLPNNVHSLLALMERENWVLRDRSTYIAEEFAAKIPDNLYINILNFVKNCGIVLFSTLFLEYKEELLKLGIDNHYYLKGCLDKRLKDENKFNKTKIEGKSEDIKETKEIIKEKKQNAIAKSIVKDMVALLSGKEINYDKNSNIKEKKESDSVKYDNVGEIIEENIIEFKTDRDAIYYKKSEHDSISKMVIEKMHSYIYDFSINKLREDLPSLKNYNFNNVIMNERQNGLINFDYNTYIYIDNLNIKADFIERMKQILKKCIDENDLQVISMSKFYLKMKLIYADMLKEYKIDNSNKLFHVAEYFCNEYYFNKPMISSNEKFYQSQYNIICNYIRELDKFSLDDVKEFIRIQRFRNLWSYSDFLVEMSSDFVQVDVDTMISIDSFNISDEELENINGVLEILLNNGTINTKSFKGYSLFPRLKYTWNKYLLIGIIRTFLSDKYEVENTERHYDSTDYIIRRA